MPLGHQLSHLSGQPEQHLGWSLPTACPHPRVGQRGDLGEGRGPTARTASGQCHTAAGDTATGRCRQQETAKRCHREHGSPQRSCVTIPCIQAKKKTIQSRLQEKEKKCFCNGLGRPSASSAPQGCRQSAQHVPRVGAPRCTATFVWVIFRKTMWVGLPAERQARQRAPPLATREGIID